MAEKQESRDDGDLLKQEDDLAPEDESEETDDDDEQEGDKKEKPESKDTKPKETNEERLARELAQTKKELRLEKRKASTAESRLTRLKGDSADEPEDLAAQLAERERKIAARDARLREQQVELAVSKYLADKHKGWEDGVEWLPAKVVRSLTEEDITEDGEYDEEALEAAIEPLARKYVEKNPRQTKAPRDTTGGAGGEGGRHQAGSGQVSDFDKLPLDMQNSLRKMQGIPVVGR